MQRLTLDQPVPEALRGAIVALGNFDGFHLGHQAVVGRAVARGAHGVAVVRAAMGVLGEPGPAVRAIADACAGAP